MFIGVDRRLKLILMFVLLATPLWPHAVSFSSGSLTISGVRAH